MSTIFIPPLHIGLIKVFLFIISLLFHRNSKKFAFNNLIVFSSGYSKIEETKISFDIAKVLITQTLPKVVNFLCSRTQYILHTNLTKIHDYSLIQNFPVFIGKFLCLSIHAKNLLT